MSNMRPQLEWLKPLSSEGSMRKAGLNALVFTGGSQFLKLTINILATLILVRLLSPNDFGLFAMVALAINFIITFKDIGLTIATIQQTNLTQRQVSTIFWLNQAGGIILTLLILVATPILVRLFEEPELFNALLIVSLAGLIGSLTAQHDALLRRNLCFGILGIIEVGGLCLGVVTAVIMASTGWGWVSLIIQRLVQMTVILIGAWAVCPWRPSFVFSWSEAKEHFFFGLHVATGNLSSYLTRNCDNLLIGWYWGATPLGLYSKAYDLLVGPLGQISYPLGQTLQPILGRLRTSPARYCSLAKHAITGSPLPLIPLGLLIFLQSELTTRVLLGDEWLDAAPILGWFGLSVCTQMVGAALIWMLVSQQRGKDISRTMVLFSFLNLLGFALSLPFGVTTMAAVYVLTGVFLRTPFLVWVTIRKGTILTGKVIYDALKLPLLGLFTLAGLYLVTGRIFAVLAQPDWLKWGAQLACGYAVLAMITYFSDFGAFLRTMVLRRKSG